MYLKIRIEIGRESFLLHEPKYYITARNYIKL